MIRQAKKEDKKEAAILMYEAILDIAHTLTGETEQTAVLTELEHLFIREGNRISYENCLVEELDGKVVGISISYPGKDAYFLDQAIKEYIKNKKGIVPMIDKEADETDFYIDTLSVNRAYRGQKIGTELLRASVKKGKEKGYKTVSLLVEQNNEKARKLYERQHFIYKKTVTVHNHLYDYLVKSVDA